MMNTLSLVLPFLCFFVVLGLCTYLLIRGITHSFVCLFALSALIDLLRSLALLVISRAPGGFSANASYLPAISIASFLGIFVFLGAFVSLTLFLLRAPASET